VFSQTDGYSFRKTSGISAIFGFNSAGLRSGFTKNSGVQKMRRG
jgi:hypothetical protein